jgi:hypothetical protein
MGIQVRAICSHYHKKYKLNEGDLNNEELSIKKLIYKTNEKELQIFRKY